MYVHATYNIQHMCGTCLLAGIDPSTIDPIKDTDGTMDPWTPLPASYVRYVRTCLVYTLRTYLPPSIHPSIVTHDERVTRG